MDVSRIAAAARGRDLVITSELVIVVHYVLVPGYRLHTSSQGYEDELAGTPLYIAHSR